MSWYGKWDGFDDEMQNAPDIFTKKPQTNADCIRAMTDEELNNWITCPKELGERTIGNCMTNGCYKCKEDWLKQEAAE